MLPVKTEKNVHRISSRMWDRMWIPLYYRWKGKLLHSGIHILSQMR